MTECVSRTSLDLEMSDEDKFSLLGIRPGVAVGNIIQPVIESEEAKIFRRYGLDMDQRRYAAAVLEGKSHLQALKEVKDCNPNLKSSQTGKLRKMNVNSAIGDILDRHGLDIDHRVSRLRDHVDGEEAGASLRAIDMTFKLEGRYAPDKKITMDMSLKEYHELQAEKELLEMQLMALDDNAMDLE